MKHPTCCDDYDPNSLSVEAALDRIAHELKPVTAYEQVPIRSALGRILAEDIQSQCNVPPYCNSAMDGYALKNEDLPQQGQATLIVVGTAFAGKPFVGEINSGECIRIFTGAVLPKDTDTVIMQEHVEVKNQRIIVGEGHKIAQNVRNAGEDIAIGQLVLEQGKQLVPADIGLLASLGSPEIKVKRRLRVAFFSTGDELRPSGTSLEPGQIYDSNRYTLHSVLTRLGVDIIDMGIVPDIKEQIEQTFLLAAEQSDAIITSGGVSVGDADYVVEILQKIGAINFWKIAMRPGRPLTFGKVQQATFFGLPGNPVSAMVTFYQFVQPALRRLMGQTKITSTRVKVTCTSALKKKLGRMEFQRGVLRYSEQGDLTVTSTGHQGSGILSSMSQANCFIILPADCGNVDAGSEVLVEPFEGLI